MLIRAERTNDAASIATVTREAFRRQNTDDVPEVALVAALRGSEAWIPQLSLVAEIDDLLVAHCLLTRAHVDGVPVLALGPISVDPDVQGQGIGSTLVRTSLEIADDMSESLVALLGDPGYYHRFGFVPGTSVGVQPSQPAWGEHFQVKVLNDRQVPRGRFEYAAPFRAVS